MNAFVDMVANTGTTQNGGVTNISSLDSNLNFFFISGGSRGKDISKEFLAAYEANPDIALRTLLWLRDAREGAGEREVSRTLFKLLASHKDISKIIDKIVEVGRWDDLLVFVDTPAETAAFRKISEGLLSGNALCAKWMPRQGRIAEKLRKHMKMKSPKLWRQFVVGLSSTVEQQMCSGQWDKIDFDKVPSGAANRYQKAFLRNAEEQYNAYKLALTKGEAKINAGALYPYEIVRSLRHGDVEVSNAQWNALPNFLEGGDMRFLPIVDTSVSMYAPVTPTISCVDIAISLGIYLSQRNTSVFKDMMISFNTHPEIYINPHTSFSDSFKFTQEMDWGGSTDIQATFKLILDVAKRGGVKAEDMPTHLLIVSDMEFNECDYYNTNVTAFEAARSMFKDAGYELPTIVFWTVNARSGNIPVTMHETGAILVSGFSPAIMKSLLKGGCTPLQVMLDTVMQDRYNVY